MPSRTGGLQRKPVTPGAYFDGALGEILPYDRVRDATEPDAGLLDSQSTTLQAIRGWDRVALESPVDVPGQCVGCNAPRSPAPMLESGQSVSAMRLASNATYAETPIDIPYRRFSITRTLGLGQS